MSSKSTLFYYIKYIEYMVSYSMSYAIIHLWMGQDSTVIATSTPKVLAIVLDCFYSVAVTAGDEKSMHPK